MNENPLIGPPPTEVPLPNAPLVRVIAQVRFPLVASIEKRAFIAPFQEAIRGEYSVLRQEAAGEARSSTAWRFHDLGHPWRVTLAADFMALETSRYTSRTDFFDRFERLLNAVHTHVKPGVLDRVGIRYIDRLTGSPLAHLGHFIKPALLGAFGTAVAPHAVIAVSEGLFDLPEERGQMRARWGVVPPNATVDPTVIEPLGERSWVLDIDTFQEGERAFVSDDVAGRARALARRAYSFFRWSVTDGFLAHFGGTP